MFTEMLVEMVFDSQKTKNRHVYHVAVQASYGSYGNHHE